MTSPSSRPRSSVPVQGAFAPAASPTPAIDTLLASAGGVPPEETEAAPAQEHRAPEAKRATPRRTPAKRRSALIPDMPEDRYKDKIQMNVRVDKSLHWAARSSSFMTGGSMGSIMEQFLEAFAEAPDEWLDFFALATESGKGVAEALNPAMKAALASLVEEG